MLVLVELLAAGSASGWRREPAAQFPSLWVQKQFCLAMETEMIALDPGQKLALNPSTCFCLLLESVVPDLQLKTLPQMYLLRSRFQPRLSFFLLLVW